MKIRNAVDGDILQMHNVRMSVVENRLTNPLSIEPHHYESLLSSGRGWVCEVDERIVGFAIADPANCSIWALFVHPDCEGRGIGRELHDIAIQWLFGNGAARIWLTTDPNTRAERFYKAAHWQYVGRQANGEARYEMTADQFAKRST